jgi:hypothetical protein
MAKPKSAYPQLVSLARAHRKRPVSYIRAARFDSWTRRATDLELEQAYKSAYERANPYQKQAILAELRRRESLLSDLTRGDSE